MSDELRRLGRWIRRARPPRPALARAMLSGVIASLTNTGLFVGALTLLVVSAQRPGLRAVAGVLIIIELLAFLRSPIRFNERLSAHRLGFQAVTHWRHWLMLSIGRWDYSRWRTYAAGDLLDRSLHDTDELQDLWLRCVIPVTSSLVNFVVGDVVIGLLPPHGGWWYFAGALGLLQLFGVAGLVANLGPLIRRDRDVRRARGGYQAVLVELSAVTAELSLLGVDDFLDGRAHQWARSLRVSEQGRDRRRRASVAISLLVSGLALAFLALHRPHSSPTWTFVVALIALSAFETITSMRGAFDTAVAVSAAAERLEDLDAPAPTGRDPWPHDATLVARDLELREGGRVILHSASLTIAPGRRVALTGTSGIGKSALLRVLAGLDVAANGSVTVGDTELTAISEAELRRHLVYTPSEPGLTRGFTVDVVGLGRSGRRNAHRDLAEVGLITEPTGKWDDLSRGERQRVAVVRAMVTSPAIYLLDEPTSGLGASETDAVLDLLGSSGATFVVATHDERVMAWCDEVVELKDQSLVALNR
jgi:ABC-type transport system involved in cytochrome bd biosynthesis fused ATPase/permease subunit